MTNILDFNRVFKKQQAAQARAHELVSDLEDQARPHIAIAQHLQLKALEKPFAEVLLEIEAAHEEASKRWFSQSE
jgi:hypothetical protein